MSNTQNWREVAAEMQSRALKAEALAREAGEALEYVICYSNDPGVIKRVEPVAIKLRAAGILKGGE